MTARSIRRTQERRAKKLACKAERAAASLCPNPTLDAEPGAQATYPGFPTQLHSEPRRSEPRPLGSGHVSGSQAHSEPRPARSGSLCPARLLANRANAQLSTGPTSETGRATSSLNAVKTGLTGRTVLLHTDDAAEYQRHVAAYEKEFSPVGQRERDLVQSIADTAWRLLRIPALEMAIYAKGRLQFADAFNEYEEALRPGMIELETFLTYEKQLRNLQLQEARLSRRREKDIAELHELQQARQKRESEALDEAVSESVIPQNNYTNCSTHGLGFEFSEPAESSDQVNAYQAGASESAEILQRGCHVV